MSKGLIVSNNLVRYYPYGDIRDRSFLMNYCTSHELVRKSIWDGYKLVNTKVREPRKLYTVEYKNHLPVSYLIPRGIYEMIPKKVLRNIGTTDNSTCQLIVPQVTSDRLATSLQPESGFDLRSDQIMAITKILGLKRGVCQLPTGSGKTEIMSSCIKLLLESNPDMHILVIEPTDILTTNTCKRFCKYKLDAVTYKESRNDLSHSVTVSHVASLLSDLKENPELLSGIRAVFFDECHHLLADTWTRINSSVYNAEYAIGMTALAVDECNVQCTDIATLSYDEVRVMGAAGPVIMWLSPKYYIDNHILATPVVMQLINVVPNSLISSKNWCDLRKYGICGQNRSQLTAKTTQVFHKYGRKTLILVGIKQQAYDIAEELANLGITDVALSFGGGVSQAWNTEYDSSVPKSKKFKKIDAAVDQFDSGEYSVLLGTSHMDEGVDVSNLDVCILAGGGKKDRRIVQRIGRALRLTKTGKYAYIIDFNDTNNGILGYHSSQRMKLFTEMIEVPLNLVYSNMYLESVEPTFKQLEELD